MQARTTEHRRQAHFDSVAQMKQPSSPSLHLAEAPAAGQQAGAAAAGLKAADVRNGTVAPTGRMAAGWRPWRPAVQVAAVCLAQARAPLVRMQSRAAASASPDRRLISA